MTKYPVRYPTACSPQAWSTGAPLLLLRTMLGLEPVGDHLVVDPVLPAAIGHLELLDIPGRWGRLDAFGRGRVERRAHGNGNGKRRRRAPEDGTMTNDSPTTRVVIVGGGFAGVACARELAKHDDVHVTLIDKNDYHQFQPLLYQVATSMLAPRDIAYPLRKIAAEFTDFEAKRGEVVAIDPVARTGDDRHAARRYAGRLPRPRRRLAAELLRHARRRARVPALLARRRRAAQHPDHPGVRGGRPRPVAGRRGRHRLRHRRRRPDRRRGRRRAVRDDQHDDGPRVPGARAARQGPARRPRAGAAHDVRRQGPRLRGARSSRRTASSCCWGPA